MCVGKRVRRGERERCVCVFVRVTLLISPSICYCMLHAHLLHFSLLFSPIHLLKLQISTFRFKGIGSSSSELYQCTFEPNFIRKRRVHNKSGRGKKSLF